MNKHVLIVVDREIPIPVSLQKARQFTGNTATMITVLAFINAAAANNVVVDQTNLMSDLEAAVGKFLGSRPQLTLDIVSTPDIARYCAQYCRTNQVDLVIKPGHRSGTPGHTPLDWQLVRTLNCPVIIAVDHNLSQARKLLVTIDAQSRNPIQQTLDRKVLEWARDWTLQEGYGLYIACCVEASDPLTGTDTQLLMDLEKKMRPRIVPVIQQMLSELSLTCKGILVSAGTPASVLKRLAEELGADLMAVGFTARHGLGEFILGHTAEKLMHGLDKNLVVIPGTGKK